MNNTFYNILAISMFLSACSAGRDVEIIKASGFAIGENKSALVFLTPEIGIAGGFVHASDLDSLVDRTGAGLFLSAIWRTADGGHDWQLTIIRDSSSIKGLTSDGQSIYASVMDAGRGSVIMRSSDTGLSWNVLCERPDNVIRDLYARDTMQLYYRSDDMSLTATSDGGKTWKTLNDPWGSSGHIFYDGATAYFLSSIEYYISSVDAMSHFTRLASLNLDTGETHEIKLPPSRYGSRVSTGNMLVLFHENEVELYRIEDDKVTFLSKIDARRSRYNPDFLYSHGDKIYLSLSAPMTSEAAVWRSLIFGVREKLMFSEDGGASWMRLRLGSNSIRVSLVSKKVATLPVGDKFNLYYIPDPLSLGVISK